MVKLSCCSGVDAEGLDYKLYDYDGGKKIEYYSK